MPQLPTEKLKPTYPEEVKPGALDLGDAADYTFPLIEALRICNNDKKTVMESINEWNKLARQTN